MTFGGQRSAALPWDVRCSPIRFRQPAPRKRLDRRGFLLTATAAGFALAATPWSANRSRPTDTDLRGTDMLEPGTGPLPIYTPRPGQVHPVVLVVQEIFGVRTHPATSAAARPARLSGRRAGLRISVRAIRAEYDNIGTAQDCLGA